MERINDSVQQISFNRGEPYFGDEKILPVPDV